MKNSWLISVFVVGVVITVLVAFNYQGKKNKVSLSEIFPDEESYPVEVEYEFADESAPKAEQKAPIMKPAEIVKPVEPAKPAKAVTTTEVSKAMTAVQTQTAAKVSTPVTTTVASPKVTQDAEFSKIPFTIQIASFKDQSSAEKTAGELKQKGYVSFIASRDLGAKGTWYRVYVGQFDSKSQADLSLAEVKKEYKDSFIISPKK